MDDSISNFWNVIISAISALVTLIAVIVAFWQTKWPYRVKLKVEARIIEQMYQSDAESFFKYKDVHIKIHNIGFTDSSILCWGLSVGGRDRFNIQYFGSKLLVLKSKTMIWMNLPLSLLQDPVKSGFSGYSKKNKKLKVFFQDIGGKVFYKSLDLTVKQLIEMSNVDFKSSITEDEYEDYYLKGVEFEPLREFLSDHAFEK